MPADVAKIEARYRAKAKQDKTLVLESFQNGFAHPFAAIITNDKQEIVQFAKWDWLPDEPKLNLLNARIETIDVKPLFRNFAGQRCLIPATAFYEWQWLDPKGKHKKKFQLSIPGQDIFSFAGLWKIYYDKKTDQQYNVYLIITTEANTLMSTIHNRDPQNARMPVIIHPEAEKEWLDKGKISMMNDQLKENEV